MPLRHLAESNLKTADLDRLTLRLYLGAMTPVYASCIYLQDRARLRERFFGAARTVLARL
ncbi:MAG: hypothetical protein FalmKO_00740 [Falsiruegeria mediterranea]